MKLLPNSKMAGFRKSKFGVQDCYSMYLCTSLFGYDRTCRNGTLLRALCRISYLTQKWLVVETQNFVFRIAVTSYCIPPILVAIGCTRRALYLSAFAHFFQKRYSILQSEYIGNLALILNNFVCKKFYIL